MEKTIDLITERRAIYRVLEESEDSHTIIGIASPDLGHGIFMTFVKEILHEADDEIIVLNNYDITGYFLERNKIPLSNIKSVIPFKGLFTNPFLKQLDPDSRIDRPDEKQDLDYLF